MLFYCVVFNFRLNTFEPFYWNSALILNKVINLSLFWLRKALKHGHLHALLIHLSSKIYAWLAHMAIVSYSDHNCSSSSVSLTFWKMILGRNWVTCGRKITGSILRKTLQTLQRPYHWQKCVRRFVCMIAWNSMKIGHVGSRARSTL